MSLTLYYGSGSQYAWRVWMALEHKQCPYDLKTLSFQAGDTRTPEFLAINPRGKVPTITDDGFALHESAAIVEYLEERFPKGPTLFPGELNERAVQRRVIAEIDNYLSPLHRALARQVFFLSPDKIDPAQLQSDVEAWKTEVLRYESVLSWEFISGPTVGAADFTLYPFVATAERLDQRMPSLQLQSLLGPRVLAWRDRMRALPYHDKTWPPHWKG